MAIIQSIILSPKAKKLVIVLGISTLVTSSQKAL